MTFDEWWVENGGDLYDNHPETRDAWNAAQKAMLDEVIEIARKHTLRPEAFIEELRKRYGVKDE